MGKTIRLKKGFDIKLEGKAAHEVKELSPSKVFSINPDDFLGINPKLIVKVGEEVKAGQALFFDKNMPNISFPSPVSGEVVEIVRGAKRKILSVNVLADANIESVKSEIPVQLDAVSIKDILIRANLWAYIKQRPFNTVADPDGTPKGVFVSVFDSSPLAPDFDFILKNREKGFQKGLEILDVLAGGKLHIGAAPTSSISASKGEVHSFSGKHPAGNVGIQIHHIDPIRPGEVVWHVNAQDVCILGDFFLTGEYHPKRLIAVTGSSVNKPQYYKVRHGQSLAEIWKEQVVDTAATRLIQGNVLTGKTTSEGEGLSFYTNQLTAIPEGNKSEFLGWLLPSTEKLSLSRSFLSWLMPSKTYSLDTNTHGEWRPFVVSGEYEKVLPMNIMPVQLLKSILANDIEKMEALGIYELAEEDLALCEFVCTSKMDVQQILRQGLDYIKTEG